jgi:transposase
MADKSYAKEAVAARTGRDIEGLLRELYLDRRWTHQEIADHFGVSRATVVDWCTEYGISRADRTATLEQAAAE